MKKFFVVLLVLGMGCFSPGWSQDAEEDVVLLPNKEDLNQTEYGTAVALSHTITSTTGVAMSPLLGMGALGAWQYFQTDESLRGLLPWYTNPWVWGVCLVIFLLIKSKDTIGAWIPEMVKKPITVLEVLQSKASALIVALAVIPASVMSQLSPELNPAIEGGGGGVVTAAAIVPGSLPVLLVPISVAIFGVVWLASHALKCILVLSPSSFINSSVALVRGVFLGAFALLATVNPWVGLAFSIVIILVCILISGWAFRWNVFGMIFVKDFFKAAWNEPLTNGESISGFSTGNFPGPKPRSYGELRREGDELIFSWKPWLIMPTQESRVGIAELESGVRKGLVFPAITLDTEETEEHRSLVDLRPRFRTHEDAIREQLNVDAVLPSLAVSGFASAWFWMKRHLKRGGTALSEALASRPQVGPA